MKKFVLFLLIFLATGCSTRKIIAENCDQTKSETDWVCEQRIWSW